MCHAALHPCALLSMSLPWDSLQFPGHVPWQSKAGLLPPTCTCPSMAGAVGEDGGAGATRQCRPDVGCSLQLSRVSSSPQVLPGLWGVSLPWGAAHPSPIPVQEGLQAERFVSHLHYTAWPDHGIPESTTSIMTFRELVREHIQSTKDAGPTLVHCR